MVFCEAVVFFANPSKDRIFSDAGNSGKHRKTRGFPRSGTRKHRKTRGFHGLARPKPAFRKGWRAKTRALTRYFAQRIGERATKLSFFAAMPGAVPENIVKRVVFHDRARENIVKRVVFTDLRVQNPRFGRVGAPKLAF